MSTLQSRQSGAASKVASEVPKDPAAQWRNGFPRNPAFDPDGKPIVKVAAWKMPEAPDKIIYDPSTIIVNHASNLFEKRLNEMEIRAEERKGIYRVYTPLNSNYWN